MPPKSIQFVYVFLRHSKIYIPNQPLVNKNKFFGHIDHFGHRDIVSIIIVVGAVFVNFIMIIIVNMVIIITIYMIAIFPEGASILSIFKKNIQRQNINKIAKNISAYSKYKYATEKKLKIGDISPYLLSRKLFLG